MEDIANVTSQYPQLESLIPDMTSQAGIPVSDPPIIFGEHVSDAGSTPAEKNVAINADFIASLIILLPLYHSILINEHDRQPRSKTRMHR
jgi:hypothetical protein